jgi:hypothetical protein
VESLRLLHRLLFCIFFGIHIHDVFSCLTYAEQDLHLAIEIFIEAVFDVVHKAAHFVLSPSDAFRTLFRLFSSNSNRGQYTHGSVSEASVPSATLGDNDPAPTERNTSFQALNTDARTCQDVITELG